MTHEDVLLAHTASTLAMFGVIWFVQLVHYPLLAGAAGAGFAAHEQEHVRRTGWVVMPLMLTEAATAAWLVWQPPAGLDATLPIVGAALLAGIWLSTFLLQVPAHDRLSRGWDGTAHTRLVRTNWIRTLLWTARAAAALAMSRAAG
jgi:hypothetical protein